jgi:hypothetical protein
LNGRLLIYAAGSLMFVIFALNLYVGLVDRNLFIPPNTVVTPHYYLNWAITIVDAVSAAVLFVKPTRNQLVALSGIIWPLVYIGSIAIDIESKLCIGAAASSCFPTISDAENYLLFGNSSLLVVYFWQYTFALILILLTIVVALSSLGLYISNKRSTINPNIVSMNERGQKEKDLDERTSKS